MISDPWKWADYIAATNVLVAAITAALALAAPYLGWRLARRSQKQDQRFQIKQNILSLLIENRNIWHSREAVRALNLIDVAFHDNNEIRSIWREYHGMISKPAFFQTPIGNELRSRKLIDLQAAIARDLGYNIDQFDIERVYSPNWLDEEQEIIARERDANLARLRNNLQHHRRPEATDTPEHTTTKVNIDFGNTDIDGVYLAKASSAEGSEDFAIIKFIDSRIDGAAPNGTSFVGSYKIQGGFVEISIVIKELDGTSSPADFCLPRQFANGETHKISILGRFLSMTFQKVG